MKEGFPSLKKQAEVTSTGHAGVLSAKFHVFEGPLVIAPPPATEHAGFCHLCRPVLFLVSRRPLGEGVRSRLGTGSSHGLEASEGEPRSGLCGANFADRNFISGPN